MLSKELRNTLIQALQAPELYEAHMAEIHLTHASNFEKWAQITFNNDDLMMGTLTHNRPLYVACNIDQVFVKRILIDSGAVVNLLSLRTLLKIGARYGV